MIQLDDIQEILKLAIYTGRLEGDKPLSVMIVANAESAKSQTLMSLAENDGILLLNSFTPTSFLENHALDFSTGKYRHLILPDLIPVLGRQKYLADATITMLLYFTEEGFKEIDSKAFQGGKISLNQPVSGGLLTSIAKEDFENRWKAWTAVGFLSRFPPVSFQYGQDTVREIFDSIIEGRALGKPIRLNLPAQKATVDLPKDLGDQLIKSADEMHKRLSTYGFRALRHLIRLAKANALAAGRLAVTQEDIDKVLALSKFCNLDYPTIGKWRTKPTRKDMELREP